MRTQFTDAGAATSRPVLLQTLLDPGGNGKAKSVVLVFDGKGGVDFGGNRKLYMRGSMTVAFWVKVDKGNQGTILGRPHHEDNEKHQF